MRTIIEKVTCHRDRFIGLIADDDGIVTGPFLYCTDCHPCSVAVKLAPFQPKARLEAATLDLEERREYAKAKNQEYRDARAARKGGMP